MDQGDHSEQLLLFALCYQSTPSCLKVMGGVGGGGGPCDYCVSSSPFGLDFGTLDLGLTIFFKLTDYKYRLKCKPNFCCEGAALQVLMSVCVPVCQWSIGL